MEAALQIIAGLILLVIGGEGVIRGAVGIARRFGMSELLIGLTLVGFGTSTPELITSVNAALAGSPGIAIGNVVGSNVSNILLILALVVMVRALPVNPAAIRRDGLLVIAVSILLTALALAFGELNRIVGAILVAGLIGYLAFAYLMERKGGASAEMHKDESHTHDPAPQALWLSALFAFGGLAILVFGADMLVEGAITTARLVGLSETVIGLTIVAVGTSLPELVASLTAALRGKSDVALGNILGSNLYNILGILGITALIQPIDIPPDMGMVDWGLMIGSAILLLILATTGKRLSRWEGALLFAGYVAYVVYLLQ